MKLTIEQQGKNTARAERARRALDYFDQGEREPVETLVVDLLTNLMHMHADQGFGDFEEHLRIARDHFHTERGTSPASQEVLIEVRGGVAEVSKQPPGILVHIQDHDNEAHQ